MHSTQNAQKVYKICPVSSIGLFLYWLLWLNCFWPFNFSSFHMWTDTVFSAVSQLASYKTITMLVSYFYSFKNSMANLEIKHLILINYNYVKNAFIKIYCIWLTLNFSKAIERDMVPYPIIIEQNMSFPENDSAWKIKDVFYYEPLVFQRQKEPILLWSRL